MSVRVEALTKRFGLHKEVVGVDAVSFTAPDHGITSLLGPSGSGKSTVLRLVAGLEEPDGGRVSIHGEDVTHVPVRQRQVGFVFQNYALFNHMSVFENIAFGLSVRAAEKNHIRSRVEELLSLVQLADYQHRLPTQLSGGQRQRVALARALATNPRVLLLDEPFGALDTQVRIELRDWLHRLHEQTQVTTLLVTHDQEEALELSEHVVLLRGGRVEQAGSPTELYEHPANAFVASFLGGAKVFTGSVRRGQAEFAGGFGTEFAGDSLQAQLKDGQLAEGTEVEAYVRPHDIQLDPVGSGEGRGPVARVERVLRVGGYAKVSVLLANGDVLTVQMARHELDERRIGVGDEVRVRLRDVKVARRANYAI
jgi:sulfate transport system ATP-binding protein